MILARFSMTIRLQGWFDGDEARQDQNIYQWHFAANALPITGQKRGRRPTVAVDEDEFRAYVVEGASEGDLQTLFGCNRDRVKYLKKRLQLKTVRLKPRCALPDREGLRTL